MRAILITGGGTGLGRELAHLFAKEGFHVMLCGRREEPLLYVKDEIEREGGSAEAFVLNITDLDAIQQFIVNTGRAEKIEILINNAGVGHFGAFEEVKLSDIEVMMDTNFYGPLYLCKTLIPFLKNRNNGTIINIISTAGLRGKANETGYCASKFAFRGLGESLQKEYENSIHIVNVFMGGMNTPFWEDRSYVKNPESFMNPHHIAQTIMEQYQTSQEIKIERKKS
ncbi:short-subunit dehydrogenase [Bacillus oleivorans]|uniref:Short-subunit dehydrogenase n=1 Tax=Bacillus oleivorans TaxID=1448271 RepID=A0A285CTD9_9BACI|nr:SDR family NAD(P)-dependent oxidoreductase [Bacillus oleivorans]SNX70318.1 short-subunit dehydrogenase [Bacillus oleivorans]